MQAKDEELTKVKEKHLHAEQKLQEMEEQQQQVNLTNSLDCVYFLMLSLHVIKDFLRLSP